jgi:hypothetical protein
MKFDPIAVRGVNTHEGGVEVKSGHLIITGKGGALVQVQLDPAQMEILAAKLLIEARAAQ